MQRLNLCIDIDGTITEPYYWLPRANQYFNLNLKPKDVTIYDIPELLGIERAKYETFYKKYGKAFHIEAKARYGVKEVINELYEQHHIHFVTAREEEMRVITIEWLKRYQIPMDTLILTGSNHKVNQATALKCDFFIEDRYENAIQLSAAGFDVLLMDCTYNKGSLPPNVKRVKNWFEIKCIIEEYSHHYLNIKPA